MLKLVLCALTFLVFCGIVSCDRTGLSRLRERKQAIDSFASQATEELKLRNDHLMDMLRLTVGNITDSGCRNATMSWIKSMEGTELWALRMLDAAGKFPVSGLLVGNFAALGSYWECVDTSEPVNKHNYSYTPVRGQYCLTTFGAVNATSLLTAYLTVKLGMCIPDACSATDLNKFLSYVLLNADKLPFAGKLVSEVALKDTTCQLNDPELTTLAISGICVVCVFGLLVCVGSLYDVVLYYSDGDVVGASRRLMQRFAVSVLRGQESNDEQADVDQERLISTVNVNRSEEVTVSRSDDGVSHSEVESESVAVQEKRQRSRGAEERGGVVGKILCAFSIRRNGAAIMNTKSSGEQLDCLHGMRFISMVWILIGHTYAVAFPVPANALLLLEHYTQSWSLQFIFDGMFAVDTFFVLSGLLTTYVTLRYISRAGGVQKFKWHLFYLHRYLRLTPVYAMLIFLYVSLTPYMSYGPTWSQQPDELCVKAWWANLLYINNFYRANDLCFPQSWYLANDMQFFLISPLVLVPLCIAPVAGIGVIFVLLAINVISTAVISSVNNFSALFFDQLTTAQQTDSLGPIDCHVDIYLKPYCRVGAYAIGMLVGYVLHRTNRKLNLNAWFVAFAWAVSIALAITMLCCLYDATRGVTVLTTAQNAAYLALSHIAWSISIGWMVLACSTGYGGWVNRFLSWKAFVPLSRLTYCVYLGHLMLLRMIFGYLENAADMREFSMFYYSVGNVVLVYAAALGLSLTFEAPFLGLEKLIFGRE